MSDDTTPTVPTVVPAIKGFEQDMTCRGFQFAEGQEFTETRPAELCRNGFHAVTQPIDVLRYYPPATLVYHHVELEDVVGPEDGADSKIAGRVIRIGARIELPAIIKAQVDFGLATASGTRGAATASGDSGAATASGYSGAATASGDSGAATASGQESVAIVTGRHGRARGALGSWIVLTERDIDWKIVSVQAFKVDGEQILPDTFYRLVGGQAVQA